MINVVLVDDDLWVMEEIRAMMQKHQGLFHVLQMASSGPEALSQPFLEQADLIILDINMPEMDGLELIRRIRTRRLTQPIIILSNYSDFGLVREALRLGAADYLLKQEIQADTFPKLAERYLNHHLAEGRPGEDPAHNWPAVLKGELALTPDMRHKYALYDTFCLLLTGCAPTHADRLKEDLPRWISEAQADGIREAIPVFLSPGRFALILFSAEKSRLSLSNAAWRLASRVTAPSGDGDYPRFCIITRPGSDLEKAAARTHEAMEGTDYFFYSPEATVIDLANVPPLSACSPSRELNALGSQVVDAAGKLDAGLFLRSFDEVISHIRQQLPRPREIRPYLDGLIAGVSMALSRLEPSENIAAPIQGSRPMVSLEDYRIWAADTAALLRSSAQTRRHGPLSQAEQYIRSHLGGSVTLNDAAAVCGFSPNYFSNLFTAAFGETFQQYVFRLRMEKASALLAENRMSVAEVAAAVGMEYHHFCKRFRHYSRMTPTEYRRRQGETK